MTTLTLWALLLGGSVQFAVAQVPAAPPQASSQWNKDAVWPYEMINYTQDGHDFRIMNAPVIVLGQIESINKIENTKKAKDYSAWLRVETFLKTDRPGQENADRIYFRLIPLSETFKKPIEAGDRCLLLLGRDLQSDNALILGTDLHYYPVTPEGMVQKFMKTAPTKEDPLLQERSLTAFLGEIRSLLKRTSIEQQARDCDLVMIGEVVDSRQGKDNARDYFYVQLKPEKIFKGSVEGEDVTFIQRGNPNRWIIQSLNRASFRVGERLVCFGNKDPTFSRPGTWNPTGKALYVFPFQSHSSLFVIGDKAWRRGIRSIPIDELSEDLASWTSSSP